MSKIKNVLEVHMGKHFYQLAPLLQLAHQGESTLQGTVFVRRGGFLAKCICHLFSFPKENEKTRLIVRCQHTPTSMRWRRKFDALKMESDFTQSGEYLVERLGPLALYLKAKERSGSLEYDFVKTKFLNIPLPKFIGPNIVAYEKEEDGQYRFFVEVTMAFVGTVISYGGKLEVLAEQEE